MNTLSAVFIRQHPLNSWQQLKQLFVSEEQGAQDDVNKQPYGNSGRERKIPICSNNP